MDIDNLSSQIPPYLFPEQKEQLFSEIKNFYKEGIQPKYFIGTEKFSDMLQGDAWGEIRYRQTTDGKERSAKAVILSNSCDVSPENKRDHPIRIVFSPLLRLDNYLARIESVRSADAAQSIGDAIRNQRITTIFYLPPSAGIPFETIVPLDNISSLPYDSFVATEPKKLSCLSQIGHYVFLVKISIHLTSDYGSESSI